MYQVRLYVFSFANGGLEGSTIFPWKEQLTTTQRKSKEQQQLSACGGGKLGITGLVEVELICTRVEETKALWLAMTGNASSAPFTQEGIELSFRAGNEDKIESVVIGVRSLATARGELAEAGLLGESYGNEISLSKKACSGLHFRFRQI